MIAALALTATLLPASPAQAAVGGTVEGRITDAITGAPLTGAHVTVSPTSVADPETPVPPDVDTDADGRYSVPVPADGRYTVYVVGPEERLEAAPYPGGTSTHATEIPVSGGALRTGIDVALRTLTTTTSTLASATVEPGSTITASATVSAADGSAPDALPVQLMDDVSVLSESTGTTSGSALEAPLSLGGLQAGTYQLYAHYPGNARYAASSSGLVPPGVTGVNFVPGEPDVLLSPYALSAVTIHVTRHGPAPAWLDTLNGYRSIAGLPPVDEDPVLSAQAKLHTDWMAAHHMLSHPETRGSSGFTDVGDHAGNTSDLYLGALGAEAITGWMEAIYHRHLLMEGELDPQHVVGYAETGFYSALERDWVHWRDPRSSPVLFPPPNSTVDLYAYFGAEIPDPLAQCPGWTAPTGVPISAYTYSDDGGVSFGSHPTLTDITLGRALPTCSVEDGGFLPRRPLVGGHRYRAEMTINGKPLSWTFAVTRHREQVWDKAAVALISTVPRGLAVRRTTYDRIRSITDTSYSLVGLKGTIHTSDSKGRPLTLSLSLKRIGHAWKGTVTVIDARAHVRLTMTKISAVVVSGSSVRLVAKPAGVRHRPGKPVATVTLTAPIL